jgi:septal ring factor EnvC (AmiA/AmiB activator)
VAETVLNQQEPKIDPELDARGQNNNLGRIIAIILCVILVGLTVYVFNLQRQNFITLSRSTELALNANTHAASNYRTYVRRYKDTKVQLDETTRKLEEVNRQLDQVTAELTSTKGMLVQTQGMLAQAQDENNKLKQELQGLDDLRNAEGVQNIGELQAKIDTLKAKDTQITTQLADLKSQLRAFEADFSNPEEGQSLIVLFQSKIKFVKSRMHYLKQEAYFTKVAAQKEKDRLGILNGNNGFLVRSGQLQNPSSTKKSFAIDVKIVQ